MQTYSYFNSSIVNDETRVITNSEDVEFKKWLNGWTEEIKSPEVWSDAVPEVPATFDAEGVELTSAVPAVPSQLISGGDVIETIIHPSRTPDPYVPPPITPDQILMQVQQRLDSFAKTRNYDGILSACTYATSSVPNFASDAAYCISARDATWAALYAGLAEVQAGTRPMPTSYTEVEAILPTLDWPV